MPQWENELPIFSLATHVATQSAVFVFFVIFDFLPPDFFRAPSKNDPLLLLNGEKEITKASHLVMLAGIVAFYSLISFCAKQRAENFKINIVMSSRSKNITPAVAHTMMQVIEITRTLDHIIIIFVSISHLYLVVGRNIGLTLAIFLNTRFFLSLKKKKTHVPLHMLCAMACGTDAQTGTGRELKY